MDVAVRLVDIVSGVEEDVSAFGIDPGADGISGRAVRTIVGVEEDYFHGYG